MLLLFLMAGKTHFSRDRQGRDGSIGVAARAARVSISIVAHARGGMAPSTVRRCGVM